jgi:1,4-dihydroxy-2-naphthoate octaprenyltransferase
MPVFLFACYTFDVTHINVQFFNIILLFIILHLLVYPASNAYNSTQDRDEGSVGLIKNPLPIPKQLFTITILFDLIAIIACLFIHYSTTILLVIYIIASRLYSWRRVRLKKYPILGFMTVFICQGALVFYMVMTILNTKQDFVDALMMYAPFAIVSSLFIGSIYPLSQIYQHEQDKKDGVYTISAMLGYRNTFLFSGIQFMLATSILSYYFLRSHKLIEWFIYVTFQLPVTVFFLYWFYSVMQNTQEANFKNTMRMNLISALSMNLCFFILILHNS